MAGLEHLRVAPHGPMPAGMLRISKGEQECYVWPVHIPGWLALGWRVAGADATAAAQRVGIAAAAPPAPITAAAATGALAEPDAAQPPSPRGRRGRRRKEQSLPVVPADTGAGITSSSDNSDGGSNAAGPGSGSENGDLGAIGTEPDELTQQAESPAASSREADSDLDPDPTTDGELSLSALPDDLFGDDPLI